MLREGKPCWIETRTEEQKRKGRGFLKISVKEENRGDKKDKEDKENEKKVISEKK